VAGSQARRARKARPWHLATRRLAALAAASLLLLMLAGSALAQADTGTIGAIGINDIRSDGILLANQNWNGPADLTLAANAGITLYRARIQLNCVDPDHDGAFDFTNPSSACYGISYDQLVAALADRGMTLLPILINMQDGLAVPPSSDGSNGSPTISEFAAFAAAAAARYGPNGSFWPSCGCTYEPIQAWEVWNEENNGYWWAGDASASAYAQVFAATRSALRSVDPQARVVVGGLTFDPHGESSFVAPSQMIAALTQSNANAFDAVAVHPYTDAVGASATQLAQSAMDYVDDIAGYVKSDAGPSAAGTPRQQVWVTEMGWSDSDSDPQTIADGFADFMNQVNSGSRSSDNVGPVFWYMLRDNSTINTIDDALGLRYTNSDGSDAGAKPIWTTYGATAAQSGTLALPPALSDSGPYNAPAVATTATKPTTKGSSGSKHAKRSRRCARHKAHAKRHARCNATKKHHNHKHHHLKSRRAARRHERHAARSAR
jgi:Glycosyl hydrolase catalytic core